MSKADTDNPDAVAVESPTNEIDQLHDPGVIVEGGVARTRDEDCINFIEGRIGVEIVDNIVAADGEKLVKILRGVELLTSSTEKGGKYTSIVVVYFAGLRLRSVALEHGKAE